MSSALSPLSSPVAAKASLIDPSIQSKKPVDELPKVQSAEKKQESTSWYGRMIVVISVGVLVLVIAELFYNATCYAARLFEAKKKLSLQAERVFEPFIAKIQKFTSVCPAAVMAKLPMSSDEEHKVFDYLQKNFTITEDDYQEILKGAHVRLDDQGKTYQLWQKELTALNNRVSSHPSDEEQFSLSGKLVSEMLFSVISEKQKSYTWFQFESSPVRFGTVTHHLFDYCLYKITGKNQGPFGSSKYTHLQPLLLTTKAVVPLALIIEPSALIAESSTPVS